MIKKVRFRVHSKIISDYNIDVEDFMNDLTHAEIRTMNLIIDHTIFETRNYIMEVVRNERIARIIRNSTKNPKARSFKQ